MDLNYIVNTFLVTLKGIPVTLIIMVVAILLSFIPALLLALGQIYKVRGVRTFSVVYLAFIRATPPILLILFFYSLFPSLLNQIFKSLGSQVDVFKFNPLYYAFIIYSLMTTGSLSEILRSAMPNLANLVINLVKGTSLVFVMTVKDITALAKIEASHSYQYSESYLVIFVIYLIICGLIQWIFRGLEKRYALA